MMNAKIAPKIVKEPLKKWGPPPISREWRATIMGIAADDDLTLAEALEKVLQQGIKKLAVRKST